MNHPSALRILLALALSLVLVLGLGQGVLAAEGPRFDPDDGEPTEFTYNADQVWFSESMCYDKSTGEFVYLVGDNGAEVRSNVANGMVVTNPVRITGAGLVIYRNSELWEGDYTDITEPGEYVVMLRTGGQTPRVFTFTLAGATNSNFFAYNLPAGMMVTAATRDGEEIYFDRYTVSMQEDGAYHIEYICPATEVVYTLDTVIDRTPPELTFEGEIDDRNRVHSALKISGLLPTDVIRVTLDGNDINFVPEADGTGELAQSGNYVITVYDAAGNSTEYEYTVLIYLDSSSLVFFFILLGALLAVGIYVYVKRKRLKIG